MALLEELGQYIDDNGIAVQATDLFLGSMPDTPDRAVCVYEYPGNAPTYVQELSTPKYESPQIQIVVRDVKYEDASELAWEVWSLLSGVQNQELSNTYYLSIRPNGSPAVLRRDTNDRVLIYFNASVDKEVTLVTVS